MAFCSSPAAALYNIRKHQCSLNRAKVKCTHGLVPFAEAVAVCALFRVTLEKFSNRRRLQLCLDQIWRKMGRKKKSPPLVNIFHISHFVFLAGLETTCYWPGWISLRGLSKWNLNTGTIVCVRVCIFIFFMERNELMAFPNCRFENFWPFGICCLFLPRWEKESRDNICCVTAAVVSNRNTPWNHHLSLCNLTVRRRKIE